MSLTTTLSSALQGLFASTAGLQTANNNIANANTPGYTRELVTLASAAPNSDGSGGGVSVTGYQSVRDELLQRQILQQTQAQGGANAQLGTLQQVQTVFASSTSDIGSQMSTLFSSLSSLSTNPSSTSQRQAVLTAGGNLATAFNNASNAVTTLQTSLNSQVSDDISQINALTQQIAALNPQIAQKNATGQDSGTLQDQQDQLIASLSKLTDVAVTASNNGVTLSTGNGAPLVVGANSYTLGTTTGSDGMTHVLDQAGNDITSSLTAGDLGGTVQVRDQAIPQVLSQLDTLASQFANAFNAAQGSGYDATGATGTAFFTMPATTSGAAGAIRLALTSPSQVAASSDGTSGSNGNLASFAAVQSSKLPMGQTPTEAYASLVYTVGSLTSSANAQSTATTASLSQLNDQLSSVSGVSIDEESTNLIRFQQAYEAAAKVVSTVSTLFDVTMNMIDTSS